MNIEHNEAVHISAVLDKLNFKIERGTLSIKDVKAIRHNGLKKYLDEKCIPLKIGKRYLKEICIYNKKSKRHFYALGFKNEEGGYELYNEVFRGYVDARAITFIRGSDPSSKAINIFKDCMDFMSIATGKEDGRLKSDTIVLNSLSLWKQSQPYIQHYGYKVAYSWLNNGKDGVHTIKLLDDFFASENNLRHITMNHKYAPLDSVNAYLVKRLSQGQ